MANKKLTWAEESELENGEQALDLIDQIEWEHVEEKKRQEEQEERARRAAKYTMQQQKQAEKEEEDRRFEEEARMQAESVPYSQKVRSTKTPKKEFSILGPGEEPQRKSAYGLEVTFGVPAYPRLNKEGKKMDCTKWIIWPSRGLTLDSTLEQAHKMLAADRPEMKKVSMLYNKKYLTKTATTTLGDIGYKERTTIHVQKSLL